MRGRAWAAGTGGAGGRPRGRRAGLALVLCVVAAGPQASCRPARPALKPAFATEGAAVRAAFADAVRDARPATVRLYADGQAVALAAAVRPLPGEGPALLLTKASELKDAEGDPRAVSVRGHGGRRVLLRTLATDRRTDLALVRPADVADRWRPAATVDFAAAAGDRPDAVPAVGRWVVVPAPGNPPSVASPAERVEAVGVVSTRPRGLPPVRLGLVFFTDPGNGRLTVGAVQDNMGAAAAGVRPGDTLLELGGFALDSADTLREALADTAAGDTRTLRVGRGDDELELDVTLMNRPLNLRDRTDAMNAMGNGVSRRRDGFETVFQHDATLEPNQCGGVLVDLDGRVVGVNIARAGRVESFALPVAEVAAAIARMREEPRTK